jgi:hypothetical protein
VAARPRRSASPAPRADDPALLDAHPDGKTFCTGHFGPLDREDVEDDLAN